MVGNVGACIQRNGKAGRGGIGTDCIVCEGAQKQPGQQPDVGDTLDEFFRSVRGKKGCIRGDFTFFSFLRCPVEEGITV